ncbi:hypothetical protein ACFVSU_07075 [Microbacterium sp. NPDC058062]|uniref:hypothetical protein n=1 Tax=Microbacterium sp. NPDC058062 TaxID=3346320 RepID=UPI0036D9B2B3
MSFGGTQALRDVDPTAAVGETVAVIGPNGAGKTAFNGVDRPHRVVPERATLEVAAGKVTLRLTLPLTFL